MKIYYSHIHKGFCDRLAGFTTKKERDEFCKRFEAAKPITATEAKKFFGTEKYESCKNRAPYAEAKREALFYAKLLENR